MMDSPESVKEPRKLCGTNLIEFSKRKIDISRNLLGNRWLSRATGCFIIAPSGHGKSSMIIQASALWSCGKPAFSIYPYCPLRILIIQAEDDYNDCIEMSWIIDRLNLTDAEKHLVKINTHLEWFSDSQFKTFFSVLEGFIIQFPCDLLIINPYGSYQGGDMKNEEQNNLFLRENLTRLMEKYNFGTLGIHHTPKTIYQNTDTFNWFDWMYAMAGAATITNWARGIIFIKPESAGTYRFIAAKRFEKLGWQDREYWFSHSMDNGKMLWVPSTKEQITSSKENSPCKEALLSKIPLVDPITKEKLVELAGKSKPKISRDNVRDYLKILIDEGQVFEHLFERERARPEIKYARTPQVNAE